jgi:hypothetical protein
MLWPSEKKGQNKDAEKDVRIYVYMKEKRPNGMIQNTMVQPDMRSRRFQ